MELLEEQTAFRVNDNGLKCFQWRLGLYITVNAEITAELGVGKTMCYENDLENKSQELEQGTYHITSKFSRYL